MLPKNANVVAVIDALGDTIRKQNEEIFFLKMQIDSLKEQLAEAEKKSVEQ